LIISHIIHGANKLLNEGIHTSYIIEGLLEGFKESLRVLEEMKLKKTIDATIIRNIAELNARTKLHGSVAPMIAEQVVNAILCITDPQTGQSDLHMVEIMTMKQKTAKETQLIKGIVMDHGARHPFMPKELKNCYILTCNVSLEFEKTEVNAKILYGSSDERTKMAGGERSYIDKRAQQIVALKERVCKNGEGFVVLNQSGIDTNSLDILANAGIMALRRVKRRNMERLVLCCGGQAVNSTDDLKPSMLGRAGRVKEITLGEDCYTTVDEVQNPKSVTILIKGPNNYTIHLMKNAINNALTSIHSTLRDGVVLPGAAAFELTAVNRIRQYAHEKLAGTKKKYGAELFASALETIPRNIASNAGLDVQYLLMKNSGRSPSDKNHVGINLTTGELDDPISRAIYDNFCVKLNILQAASMVTQNLLSVDAVIKSAPESMRKKIQPEGDDFED